MGYQFSSIAQAIEIAGSIGFPSKMPGTSYGIPAQHCHTGSKLHAVPDSVCSDCYALKGRYGIEGGSVAKAQAKRYDSLSDPQWRDAIVHILRQYHGLVDGRVHRKIKRAGLHRWHDSGDIQSERHLDAIVDVCRATPEIQHWLPTRETALISRWLKSRYGATLENMNEHIPANLCIRVSATMIDGPASSRAPNTSRVASKGNEYNCHAPSNKGECGECSACWQQSIACITYKKH